MSLLEWIDYLLESFFRTPDPKDPISSILGLVESLFWLWYLAIIVDGVLLCIYSPNAFLITLLVLTVLIIATHFILQCFTDPGTGRPYTLQKISLSVLVLTFAPLYIAMGVMSRNTLLVCIAITLVLYLMVWIRIMIIRRREEIKSRELNSKSSRQEKFHQCVLL